MTEKLKTCSKCGESKPLKQFNKRLTLAQTKAFLQNPNIQTRYTTQSKNCMSCRNEMKRRTPLSRAEIRTKISTGDIRPYIGEAMLKEMREQLPKKRSRIMKEHWQKKRGEPIAQLKDKIQKQVAQYGNRYHAYKAQPDPQHALLEHHRKNYENARLMRDELFKELDAGTSVPKDFEGSKLNEVFTRRKL